MATSSEYEAEANRLRAQIGVAMGALRSGLTPSNLASEAASRVGMADLSWAGAFDYASKRHPVPTAIIGWASHSGLCRRSEIAEDGTTSQL